MANDIGLKIGLEGEKEFKKALSEINSTFKVLGSEMKLAESQFDKNEKSVESLTSRNTVLNKEIEAQKQKVEVLRNALDNAADSFGENDKRTQSWQIQLNNAEAALNSMEREMSDNEKAIEDLGDAEDDAEKDTKDLAEAIDDSGDTASGAKDKFMSFGNVIKDVAKATAAVVTAIGTAAVAAGKAVWDMANDTASAGDAIDKTSQKIGISAEAYQEWSYVFERCGSDVDKLQVGMKTLSTVIADAGTGSESAAEKLSQVGLSIEDLNGLSQEEQLSKVISALQGMEAGAERTAAATDLLGKAGVDMAAVLNMSAEETQGLIDEAHDYGMVMSNEAVSASATFEDSLTRLNNTFGGLKNNMVGEMLPALTQIMDGLSDLAIGSDGASESIQTGVQALIDNITSFIPQIVELIATLANAVLESAPSIITALATGIIDAIPELLPTAVTIITELVEALMDLLPQILEAGVQVLCSLIAGIAEALPDLIPAMVDVVMTMVQTLVDNLPMLLDAALQLITGFTTGIINSIPVIIKALPQIITSIVTFLVNSIPQLINAGIELFVAIISDLPHIITEIVKAVPQIITGIITAFGNLLYKFPEIGKNIVRGLWEGIQGLASWLWDKVSGWISSIWDGICDFFGIHSPSREMAWIGEMMTKGLAGGIEDSGDLAVDAVTDMGRDIDDAMMDVAKNLQTSVPTDFDFTANANLKSAMNDGFDSGAAFSFDGLFDVISSAVRSAMSEFNFGGETVVPVYIGDRIIDELIIDSKKRVSVRSGGLVSV